MTVSLNRCPSCFNGLSYRCGFPQIKIVRQEIRGIPLECFLDPAARLELGARWVNSYTDQYSQHRL